MRVLFVSHSFPPPDRPATNIGGMQRVAVDLAEALSALPDLTFKQHVLHTPWKGTHRRTAFFLIKCLWEIPRLVRQQKYDVVLFSSMVTGALAVFLRRRLPQTALVAIAHGRDVTLKQPIYQRVLLPRVFRALDAILPVSRATGHACMERGYPTERIFVVPNGFDPDRFSGAANPTEMDRPPFLLLSVGRQVERKGFGWFIESVMPHLPESVHYWLAGEGPETPNLQRRIADLNLGHRVRLLGRVSEADLHHLYRHADLFIMPNIPIPGDMEGFGVVLLEAGTVGLPVLAAALEGIQDVIAEDQNGHLLPATNAAAFIEKIRFYHENPEARQTLAERAQRYVKQTFTWSTVAQKYVAALHEICARQPEIVK